MATFDKVSVDITVVLGTTSMPIHQVLRLGRGAIIELESAEDDAVSILANNLAGRQGHGGGQWQSHRGRGWHADAAPARYALRAGIRPVLDAFEVRAFGRKTAPTFAERAALVPQDPICYIVRARRDARFSRLFVSLVNAAMAELVDALP